MECGHSASAPSVPATEVVWTTLAFDGKRITAGRLTCPICRSGYIRYFEFDEADAVALATVE